VQANKAGKIRYSGVTHIHQLYSRALARYKHREDLWLHYLSFCCSAQTKRAKLNISARKVSAKFAEYVERWSSCWW